MRFVYYVNYVFKVQFRIMAVVTYIEICTGIIYFTNKQLHLVCALRQRRRRSARNSIYLNLSSMFRERNSSKCHFFFNEITFCTNYLIELQVIHVTFADCDYDSDCM